MLQRLKKSLSAPFSVFVLQISMITIIIIAVTAVKFLGGDMYMDLKKWYVANFEDETSAKEVINPSTDKKETQVEKNTEKVQQTITLPVEQTVVNSTTLKVEKTNVSGVNSLHVPLENATTSSEYGERINPITQNYEKHKGIDLSAPSGSSIYAAADGTVVLAQKSSTYGNYIIIDHSNGFETLYAHCSKLLVSSGQSVKKGQVIAKVGSTGQSTRPHLHFEVRLNNQSLNPSWLINW